MKILFNTIYKKIYAFAFLGCVAVLPMSDTIALRNIFLASMLFLIVYGVMFSFDIRKDFSRSIKLIPIPLILWVLYLCIFPLWAPMPTIAWENLRGQWGESIIAWTVGLGAAVVFRGDGPDLWDIGLASAFPLIIHLLLACLAYFGVFSVDYYGRQSLAGLFLEFTNWLSKDSITHQYFHPLEHGFLGIETQPGNIGYASSVSIGIFSLLYFISKRNHDLKAAGKALLLIILCFLSVLIARSRGGFLFGLLIIGFVALLIRFSSKSMRTNVHGAENVTHTLPKINFFLLSVILVFVCISYVGIKSDPRWGAMADKVRAGFLITDPISTLCNGLSDDEERAIRARLSIKSREYADYVIDGVKGEDGGRVILMRAGIQLVLKNPVGLDGSRQSYERLIRLECNKPPALNFANAHNSWIDLSLGLGWVGVALFSTLFLYFIRFAMLQTSSTDAKPFIVLLGLLAAFWIVRGFFDAVFREHYLEMQGLLIAYLYMSTVLKFSKKNEE